MGQCSTCPLETLLGLERNAAREAVAKLAAGLPAEAGAYTPLQRHPGSRTNLLLLPEESAFLI